MAVHQQKEALEEVILKAHIHTAATAHQARVPLAPLCVQALDLVRQTATFVTRMVLLCAEKAAIGPQMIRKDRFILVIRRDIRPGKLQHLVRAVADHKADYLSDQPRDRRPEPEAGRDPDAQFIYLYDILLGRGNGSDALLLELSLYAGCLFFRITRMVCRPTLSVRAMPRCEVRSCRARQISSSFSGVSARLLGLSVKVLPQSGALHRQRAVPERLVPNLMTSFVLPQ